MPLSFIFRGLKKRLMLRNIGGTRWTETGDFLPAA